MSEERAPSPSAVRASREVRAVIGRLRRRIRAAGVGGDDDISLPQASVLARLSDNDGLTTSDLAAVEGVRHQSMTATVAALTGLGLVERHRDPADGRRMVIAVTEEGRRRADVSRQARGEWLATELEHKCTEEERQTVIAAMSVLERLVHD